MLDACVSGAYSAVKSLLASVRHPILLVLLVGIIVRLLIMPFSLDYDMDYWAAVIRNIEAGNGLYDAEGYYYTPVWGYFLGLVSVFQTFFLEIGEMSVRVIEALSVEGIFDAYYTANAPSIAFIYSVKVPLMFFDIIMSLLVAVLVRDYTGDSKKAALATALTFLCPVLICSSCVIGMPDTIAVTFALLTVVLVRRGYMFLAGMTFAMAVLTKFFPVFLIFLLVAYILSMNRNDLRRGTAQVGLAAVGAVLATGLVFAPQLIEGNIEQCFQFLTDRTVSVSGGTLFDTVASLARILTYAAVMAASVVVGVYVYRSGDRDPDELLLKGCLLVSVLCLVYPPTTQYMVIMVPFLAVWAASRERKYILSWKLIAVGAVVYVFASNALTAMPLAAWTGLVSADTLMAVFDWFDTTMVGPFCLREFQFVVGGVIQCVGVFSVLILMFRDRLRPRGGGVRDPAF